ncbi:MAG: Trm112 family protein [Panacagrimonas sp.]
MLDILVCPVTGAPLEWHADKQELWSPAARLAYPVRDGVPVMLEDEARLLSEEEIK